MILERLGKYQEALDVIRGKLGGNLKSFLFCFQFEDETYLWLKNSHTIIKVV